MLDQYINALEAAISGSSDYSPLNLKELHKNANDECCNLEGGSELEKEKAVIGRKVLKKSAIILHKLGIAFPL